MALKTTKVFAFFGDAVRREGGALLRRYHDSGFTLLPLDTEAIVTASAASVPFTFLNDWISHEKLESAFGTGRSISSSWFELAREEFTSDGICWPEIDGHAMFWFWTHINLANCLAEALRADGVRELHTFQSGDRRPCVYYQPCDVLGAFWQTYFQDRKVDLRVSEVRSRGHLLGALKGGARKIPSAVKKLFFSSFSSRPPSSSPDRRSLSGKRIVAVINAGEYYRFKPFLRTLARESGGRAGMVFITEDARCASDARSELSLPVYTFPSPCAAHRPDLQKQFSGALLKARTAAREEPWSIFLEGASSHFEYYANIRWPALAEYFAQWLKLWQEILPEAVICSSLEDCESLLPALSARRLGIKTISIPHGGVQVKTIRSIPYDYVLHQFPLQRKAYEQDFPAGSCFVGCNTTSWTREYGTSPVDVFETGRACNILTLTSYQGFPGILSTGNTSSLLECLRVLANPPSDISKKIKLLIKTHPNASAYDLKLFSLVEPDLRGSLLPPDANLEALCTKVDLVLALNYTGTALISVLRSGKPLVLVYHKPFFGRGSLNITGDLFLEAGLLLQDPGELWNTVGRFITDSRFADELRAKASAFTQKNLDSSAFRDVESVLRGLLSALPGYSNGREKGNH